MAGKPIVIEIPHHLGSAEARRRFENGIDTLQAQLGGKAVAFEQHFEDGALLFTASTFGQTVRGRVAFLEELVVVTVELPWLMASAADKLSERIRSTATLLIEKK